MFQHQGVVRTLVAEFKFGGQPVLGRVMADLALPAFVEYVESISSGGRILVTWVPTHVGARRKRGYNQAEIFARAVAERSALPFLTCANLATKVAATRHQKELGRAGRSGNLRGVFAMPESAVAFVGRSGFRSVVLIDDVYTTGATAGEVSSVIRGGCGLSVHVFTFSRAVAGGIEGHD